MSNKTCGECLYFDHYGKKQCDLDLHTTSEDTEVCNEFESRHKLTNGDKIRQMSNEELEEVIDCPYGDCIHRYDEYPCECCKRDWINAPDINVGTMESEVDNG